MSRLGIVTVGLRPGQSTCTSSSNTSTGSLNSCCLDHPHYNESAVAVVHDNSTNTTAYELSFSKHDLLGSFEEKSGRWTEGLHFGFSMVFRDFDRDGTLRGWAGYDPDAIMSRVFSGGAVQLES